MFYVNMLCSHKLCDSSVIVTHERHASCCCSQTCYPWVYEYKWLTLDHADVIGSISNSQGDGPLVPLYQLHYLGLLHRSDPAADDRFTQTGQIQQDVLQLWLQSVSLQGEHIQHGHQTYHYHPIPSTLCGCNTQQQLDVTLPRSCCASAQGVARVQLICEEMDVNENL